MDVFLSYSSSGLKETRELLTALEGSFGSVDWVSADSVDGRALSTEGWMPRWGDLTRALDKNCIILLMFSPSGIRSGFSHNANGLLQASPNITNGLSFDRSGSYFINSSDRPKQKNYSQILQYSHVDGLGPPDNASFAMVNCIESPFLSRRSFGAGNAGLRTVVNMARSISPFDGAALRRMKSNVILRLLATQTLSATDKLHFDWRLVESLILLIKPAMPLQLAAGPRETLGSDTCAIGILKAASSELRRLLMNISRELPAIRRRYQPEQISWLVSAFQAANQIFKGSAKAKLYSIAKLKEFSRTADRSRRRRAARQLIAPDDIVQSATVAHLFRGVDGPLRVGAELRRRTFELVQQRSLWAPVTAASRLADRETIYSLYRGFEVPHIVAENGSDE